MHKKEVNILRTLDKILHLLESRNIKQKDLTDYLGISKNVFTDWKAGKNTSYKKHIVKIAEFFGVSTDYLLNHTNVLEEKIKNSPAKTDEGAVDEYIIHRLLSLTPEELAQVDAFVQGLLANRKE